MIILKYNIIMNLLYELMVDIIKVSWVLYHCVTVVARLVVFCCQQATIMQSCVLVLLKMLVINQVNGTQERTAYFTSNLTLSGDWHLLQLLIDESGIQVKYVFRLQFKSYKNVFSHQLKADITTNRNCWNIIYIDSLTILYS